MKSTVKEIVEEQVFAFQMLLRKIRIHVNPNKTELYYFNVQR